MLQSSFVKESKVNDQYFSWSLDNLCSNIWITAYSNLRLDNLCSNIWITAYSNLRNSLYWQCSIKIYLHGMNYSSVKKKNFFFWQYFFAHLLSNGANLDLSKWVSSLNVSFKCLQDMNCHSSFFHPSWTTRNILKVKQWRHRYDVVIFSKFSTKGLKVMLTNLTLSWRRFLSFRN